MKKHLAWILALVTVLAVLAACTTGGGNDTTVGDTTVTDPATNEPTDAPTEAPADDGCGSVMGFGVIALLGAAFVALKKDRE